MTTTTKHNNPREWFSRCLGSWISHRRYLYGNNPTPHNLVTEFSITEAEPETGDSFTIRWTGKTNGTMTVVIRGEELLRSRNYFGATEDDGNSSNIQMIDKDTICLTTSYGGSSYREEIRLLENDSIRLRQTIGISNKDNTPTLIGQYSEKRVG